MTSHGTDSEDDVESSAVDTDSTPVGSRSEPVRQSLSGGVTSATLEDEQPKPETLEAGPAQAQEVTLAERCQVDLKEEAQDTADPEQVPGDGEHEDHDEHAATDGPEDPGEDDGEAGRTRSSRYRGVCWNKKNKRWQAAINTQGRYIYLGSFHSEERAARAFDLAAIKLRGPRARLNFACGDYLSKVGGLVEESALDTMVQAADDKQDTWRAIRRRRRRKASIITQPVSSNQSTGTEILASGADPAWQGLGAQLPSRLRGGLVTAESTDRNTLLLNLSAAANGGLQVNPSGAAPQVHQVHLQLEGGGSTLLNVGPDGTLLGLPAGQQVTLQQLLGIQGEGAPQIVSNHRMQQSNPPRHQNQQQSLMQQLHAARPSGYQNSPQMALRQAVQQPRRSSDDASMLNWLNGKQGGAQEAPSQSTSFTISSSMLPQLLGMGPGQASNQPLTPTAQMTDGLDGSSAVATVEALVPNSSGSMQCVIYRTVSSPDRLTCTLVSTEGSPHHLGAYNSLSDAHQACVAAMKLLESYGGSRSLVDLSGSRQSGGDMQLLLQQQQYAQQHQHGQHNHHQHHLQSSGSHTPTLASLPYVLLSQSSDNEGLHQALLQAQHQGHSREAQHYVEQLGQLVVSSGMHGGGGHGPGGHDLLLLTTQDGMHAPSRKHEGSAGAGSSGDHGHLAGWMITTDGCDVLPQPPQHGNKRQMYEDPDPRHDPNKRQRTLMAQGQDSGSPQQNNNMQHEQTLQALLRQAIMLHSAGS